MHETPKRLSTLRKRNWPFIGNPHYTYRHVWDTHGLYGLRWITKSPERTMTSDILTSLYKAASLGRRQCTDYTKVYTYGLDDAWADCSAGYQTACNKKSLSRNLNNSLSYFTPFSTANWVISNAELRTDISGTAQSSFHVWSKHQLGTCTTLFEKKRLQRRDSRKVDVC